MIYYDSILIENLKNREHVEMESNKFYTNFHKIV